MPSDIAPVKIVCWGKSDGYETIDLNPIRREGR
jgi:hypothetical protein